MKKIITGVLIAGIAAGVLAAETLKPDPETIPEATSTSVFYFVAPTERAGSSSVSAEMPGLTTEAVARIYEKMFESDLTSYPQGLILIVR